VNFNKPLTQVCDSTGACTVIENPVFGTKGDPTANSPPMQFSLRARYDWHIGDYASFVQFGATHSGHSFTQAGANPVFQAGGTITNSRGRFENPAYSVFDASVGIAKDFWYANVFVENLANSNASVFVSTDQFIIAQTPLRPRVIGVQLGCNF
jgi:hypothetical protein